MDTSVTGEGEERRSRIELLSQLKTWRANQGPGYHPLVLDGARMMSQKHKCTVLSLIIVK